MFVCFFSDEGECKDCFLLVLYKIKAKSINVCGLCVLSIYFFKCLLVSE